jgi:hypothetical protein
MNEDSRLSIGQKAAHYATNPRKVIQKSSQEGNVRHSKAAAKLTRESSSLNIPDFHNLDNSKDHEINTLDFSNALENSKENYIAEGKVFVANLDQKFSKEVAIFFIEGGENRCFFHIHNAILGHHSTVIEDRPILSYASHMEGDNPRFPREVRGFARAFSKKGSVKQIRGWLIKLQKILREEYKVPLTCLIINDRTDYEIPWEMLDLTSEEPIGAALATVRWQDIPDPDDLGIEDESRLLEFTTDFNNCCGKILAYANTKELHNVKSEIETLKQFDFKLYEDLYDFLNSVDQVKSALSLLFIASHGFYDENIDDIAIGEQDGNRKRFTFMELHNWDFLGFKIFPSVVFMNACHSGRLLRDSELNIFDDKYRNGLATFFLERGAKGVVGVMGKVHDEYAARIAHSFFEEYQIQSSLTVPEILRNLRAKASQALKKDDSEDKWFMFHYTFMYVYYGHPLVRLLIDPSKS